MIQLYKMAWRDLGRNRRRTFFSILALAVGVGLLLFMASFIAGEYRGAMLNSIKLQTGHVQVWAASYNQDKTSLDFKDLIENPEALAAQIAARPEVQVATPRLYVTGIVVVGDTSTGVRIIGIDPASPASASRATTTAACRLPPSRPTTTGICTTGATPRQAASSR